MSYNLCFPNVRQYLQSQEVNIYEIFHEEKHIIFRQKWCFYFILFYFIWGVGGRRGNLIKWALIVPITLVSIKSTNYTSFLSMFCISRTYGLGVIWPCKWDDIQVWPILIIFYFYFYFFAYFGNWWLLS